MAAMIGIVFGLAYAGLAYRNQRRAEQRAVHDSDGDSRERQSRVVTTAP
ncbi:MAG: hypothetical protein ACR2OE_00150 [Thermomicrobiales bacterium]